MARVFSLMTCVMLFLTVNESTLKSTEGAQLGNGSSSGGGLEAVVSKLVASVKSMKEELEAVKRRTSDIGSTFVRWGRKTCPAKTTLVYSGMAAGKHYDEKGDGPNKLCLTRSQQIDKTTIPLHYGILYGAEYKNIEFHHNYNVPCSVCRAPQPTTIMMAATLTCPPGWEMQYTGYLTSQRHNLYATEYVCLDRNLEDDNSGGSKKYDGLFFYHVLTVCGSLPCPPFQHKKVVTCVVCSG